MHIEQLFWQFRNCTTEVSVHGERRRTTRKAEQRLEADHLHKKHKNLLEEWETMQSNLRLLHQELCYDVLDDAARLEIEGNVAALVKNKNQLAMALGLKFLNFR